MRRYPVPTNTDVVLELPALTVTVRTAFYAPPEVLAPRDSDGGRGRETWKNGRSAEPFFKISASIEPGKPVGLMDVVDLDGNKVQAKTRTRKSGIAVTDVRSEYDVPARKVGEAQIPLHQIVKGTYLLAIVPAEKETTKPDAPSSPKTTIEPGVERTYRPLYVQLRFDDDVRLVDAKVVVFEGGQIRENTPILDPETKKVAGYRVSHGYVTAFSESELAIDYKPDFFRTVRTDDAHKGAAESGKWSRHVDLITVHATGGPILGPALNTALGKKTDDGHPYSPHYEIDLDGHTLKFAYDDAVVSHAGPSRFYDVKKKADLKNIGSFSIGIEVINKAQSGKDAQAPYTEPQILSLMALLKALADTHPQTKRHRILGHSDISTDDGFTALSDRRIQCPGRQMPWPRLERAGLGRLNVEKTLGKTDYSGFFSLTPADFPKKFPGRPRGDAIFLKKGDSDSAQKWGGIDWTSKAAQELLAAKGLVFDGIVREVQSDLQAMGYFIDVNGEWDFKTHAAVQHYLFRTFSGERRGLIPGGNGLHPKVQIGLVVARYLKGTAERLLADIAAVAPGGGGAGGGAAGGAAGPQHAEVETDGWGDLHDSVAEAEVEEPGESEEGVA